jgi:MFS family permease
MTLTNVRKLFNSLASFIPSFCMIGFCFCDENRQILGVIIVLLLLLSSGKLFEYFFDDFFYYRNYTGFGYGSGYLVNFSDIVPAYAGLIFGITTSISSLSAVIGNIIAGTLIKHPTLDNWRKLFILFCISYLIGGIIYILLGSGVPEKWATFKSQEKVQNGVHSQEETVPMQKQQQIDELKANGDTKTDQTMNVKA